jgi:hypothetical protein
LERTGGFREDTYTGEDTDLAMRACKAGARVLAAPEVLTYHAVVELGPVSRLRALRRWEDLPVVVGRHPELRHEFTLWIFWKRTHLWLGPFAAGAWLAGRRNPAWAGLCVPWLMHGPPGYGNDPRSRLRALVETPSALLRDAAEFAVLAAGSVKHRTLLV